MKWDTKKGFPASKDPWRGEIKNPSTEAFFVCNLLDGFPSYNKGYRPYIAAICHIAGGAIPVIITRNCFINPSGENKRWQIEMMLSCFVVYYLSWCWKVIWSRKVKTQSLNLPQIPEESWLERANCTGSGVWPVVKLDTRVLDWSERGHKWDHMVRYTERIGRVSAELFVPTLVFEDHSFVLKVIYDIPNGSH